MREKRTKKKLCDFKKKNEKKKKSKKYRENEIIKKIEIEEKRGERDTLL
jgi:2-iminoacetate synthase ThiH